MSEAAAQAALAWLLAPLQAALADPGVTEILVNGPQAAWIERDGDLFPFGPVPAPAQLCAIARLVANLSRVDTLDREAIVEGRWQEWRVTMALPPVSGDHPCLALRRHRGAALPLNCWSPPAAGAPTAWPAGCAPAPSAPVHALPAAAASPGDGGLAGILRQALDRRDNILVVGATGSGKTTLLASLLAELPARERLVCLEDTPELPWLGPHQLRLYSRQGHSLRSLLRLALRLRPDRIVVGEVRGSEAFDLLQAMATGHRGCLATLHASDAAGALHRLEQLVLTAALDWPLEAVRRQIADNVQVVMVAARSARGRQVREVSRQAGLAQGDYRLHPYFLQGSAGAADAPVAPADPDGGAAPARPWHAGGLEEPP